AIIKRITARKRIEELTIFANGLKKSIAQSVDINAQNRYEKKLKKLERKIEDLRLITTPKKNFSREDQLRYMLKITRNILVGTIIIALLTTSYALGFYRSMNFYMEDNSNLYEEINDLEVKITNLEYKKDCFDWYNKKVKIVIANEGPLYKTYHTYDCEKWRGCDVWMYNKEQVINNSEYTKCPDCNEE
ncbi:MAG: hypothetical protein IKJ55_00495, partial [Clostridia bacterium]|nr:hypothetical protein [Clostridia bacterium]